MPITLGSNIASLRGQLGLNKVTAELRSVYERLSSGQRINRASDDAAGLAVSESLKADTRIYAQGIRNVNDGVSLLNIADSALENMSTIVTRLQELAEQASNGIYGVKQRQALDAEAQALSKEFTRIQQSTSFNGINLLNGDLSNLQIQAGHGLSAILDLGVGGAIGDGTLGSSSTLFSTSGGPRDGVNADLNNDGYLDMVTVEFGQIRISHGNGSGGFTHTLLTDTTNALSSVGVGDFNGDGVLDIFGTSGFSNSYSVFLSQSNGNYSSAVTNIGTNIGDFAIGDINNDGHLDIVGAGGIGNAHILLGNGQGTFQQSAFNSTGTTGQVVLGDFNGDGNLDLAAHDLAAGNLRIFNGLGNGTFNTSAQVIPTALGTLAELSIGDLNNDGHLDLVVTKQSGAGTRVYTNQGNGTFNLGTNYASSQNDQTATLADFDGDGYLDLLNGHMDGLSVRLNQGNGTFGSATNYFSGASNAVNGVLTTGDFNNDGVLDVAFGTGITDQIKMSFGNTTDGVAPILNFSLKTMADSRQALSMLKNKSTLLSKQRGEIGAYQARLEVANNVLAVSKENFEQAGARIRDADIAEESSKLVRNSILQQTASSILGQANLQPQLALRLLS